MLRTTVSLSKFYAPLDFKVELASHIYTYVYKITLRFQRVYLPHYNQVNYFKKTSHKKTRINSVIPMQFDTCLPRYSMGYIFEKF